MALYFAMCHIVRMDIRRQHWNKMFLSYGIEDIDAHDSKTTRTQTRTIHLLYFSHRIELNQLKFNFLKSLWLVTTRHSSVRLVICSIYSQFHWHWPHSTTNTYSYVAYSSRARHFTNNHFLLFENWWVELKKKRQNNHFNAMCVCIKSNCFKLTFWWPKLTRFQW